MTVDWVEVHRYELEADLAAAAATLTAADIPHKADASSSSFATGFQRLALFVPIDQADAALRLLEGDTAVRRHRPSSAIARARAARSTARTVSGLGAALGAMVALAGGLTGIPWAVGAGMLVIGVSVATGAGLLARVRCPRCKEQMFPALHGSGFLQTACRHCRFDLAD